MSTLEQSKVTQSFVSAFSAKEPNSDDVRGDGTTLISSDDTIVCLTGDVSEVIGIPIAEIDTPVESFEEHTVESDDGETTLWALTAAAEGRSWDSVTHHISQETVEELARIMGVEVQAVLLNTHLNTEYRDAYPVKIDVPAFEETFVIAPYILP